MVSRTSKKHATKKFEELMKDYPDLVQDIQQSLEDIKSLRARKAVETHILKFLSEEKLMWGFDYTTFDTPAKFKEVLRENNLNKQSIHSRDKGTVFERKYPVWFNKDKTLQLITKFDATALSETNPVFAGYIGIIGNISLVKNLVDSIKRHSTYIKGESPYRQGFLATVDNDSLLLLEKTPQMIRKESLFKEGEIHGSWFTFNITPKTQTKKSQLSSAFVEFEDITLKKHSKTGEDLWVIKLKNRIGREEFKILRKIIRTHEGKYSTYLRAFYFTHEVSKNDVEQIIQEFSQQWAAIKEKEPEVWETGYHPFTKKQQEDFNEFSHFSKNINDECKLMVKNQERRIMDLLKLKSLNDIPPAIKSALTFYRKAAHNYLVEQIRRRKVAPPTSVVGRSKYRGRPKVGDIIERNALEMINKAKLVMEKEIDRAYKKKREKELESIAPLDFTDINKRISNLRKFLKPYDIEIRQSWKGKSKAEGEHRGYTILEKEKNVIHTLIVNENGYWDFHLNQRSLGDRHANTIEEMFKDIKELLKEVLIPKSESKTLPKSAKSPHDELEYRVFFHETARENLESINEKGLKRPVLVNPVTWYMLTDTYEGALEYTSGDKSRIILEFKVPSEVIEDYIYLKHPGYSRFYGNQYGIKQTIPVKFLVKVHYQSKN